VQATDHIAIDADTCSGHPRVAGTRIRVSNVVLWTEQGKSPDEIVAAYPQLSLADVYAALAFYFDHREEMNQLIHADEEFISEMQSRFGTNAFVDKKPQNRGLAPRG
jgi:uncharacterized protein (DUF433 family)